MLEQLHYYFSLYVLHWIFQTYLECPDNEIPELHHQQARDAVAFMAQLSAVDRDKLLTTYEKLRGSQRYNIFSRRGGMPDATHPANTLVDISTMDVMPAFRAEIESYCAELESKSVFHKPLPPITPSSTFAVHSSAPVFDIGETIARGGFALQGSNPFPTSSITGGTQGRVDIVPFWNAAQNEKIPEHAPLLLRDSDIAAFLKLQEEALTISASYNEEMATYFYAMDAFWLQNARTEDDYVDMHITDLMHYTGKKPVTVQNRKTNTFRPDQIQQAGMMVYRMGYGMVEVERAIVRGKGERVHYQRIWDMSDVYTLHTLDGNIYIDSVRYRPNELFRQVSFGTRRETALLMSKVLALPFDKQLVARRLGRYYTWLWRDRAFRGDFGSPISCDKLLERISLKPEEGREWEMRVKLEKALQRLEKEGIISSWQLLYPTGKPADSARRFSLHEWRNMKIAVVPPEEITRHYNGRISAQSKPKAAAHTAAGHTAAGHNNAPDEFDGAALRAQRLARNMTLHQLSAQTNIPVSALSRIENNTTRRLREEQRNKLEQWLST